MDQQPPQDPSKIDLSSVNKEPKQPLITKLTNLFNNRKKAPQPGRDHLGQFVSGSGGLKSAKKFNWSRALPLILIVSLVGGYLVFRSFAGTYTTCATNDNKYIYTEECVTNSNEAAIIRLYYGIFNRAPDKSGMQYWTNKLNAKKVTLTEVARQFMGSSEFRSKYGTLSDESFVKAMYLQAFGSNPDPSTLSYWTNKLKSKSVTRQTMMVNFTQSEEMKRAFSTTVAGALRIDPKYYLTELSNIPDSSLTCYGTKVIIKGKTNCRVKLSPDNKESTAVVSTIFPAKIADEDGQYTVCFSYSGDTADSEFHAYYSAVNNLSDSPIQRIGVDSGGGLNLDRGSGVKRSCKSNVLSKEELKKTLLISANKYTNRNGSIIDIDMSSIQIGRAKERVISLLREQPGVESRQFTLPEKLKVGSASAKKVTMINYTLRAPNSRGNSYISAVTPTFSGKAYTTIGCNNFASSDAILKVVLTDAKTSKLISKGYTVVTKKYGSKKDETIYKPGQDIVMPQSGTSFSTVEMDNGATARSVKIETQVKRGSCTTTSSQTHFYLGDNT